MENLELNKKEKMELKKRGFFVINYFSYPYLLLNIVLYLGFIVYSILLSVIFTGMITLMFNLKYEEYYLLGMWFFCIPGVLMLLRAVFYYIFLGKFFYTNNGIILYPNIYKKIEEIKSIHSISLLKNSIDIHKKSFINVGSSELKLILLILPTIIPILLSVIAGFSVFLESILLLITSALTAYIIYFLRQLVEYLHPLYAFGNLGEKIQKMTPQIEEQSQKIQSEFQSDISFSVLNEGFDSLSNTFSEIVSLVIKLEKVEARANKGNLFDSEKYINSLRSDIIIPLASLKAFLDTQKYELMNSQKELTRVRVGGSESSGNMELQSNRSESLIQELTENIEKLDVMIGKMGV